MPTLKSKKKSVSKKPASKTGARMSPDAWAERLDGWQADALKLIRALVARHAPKATLAIKWGQPVWDHNGPMAFAKPAKNHITFGFWRGAELADPDGHLEGAGNRMRHVKVTSVAHVKALPLASYVKQAVSLNDAKGDPTRRKRAART
jgi:hypothetical protein